LPQRRRRGRSGNASLADGVAGRRLPAPKEQALARLPLFEGLKRVELERLAMVTEEVDFPQGRILCHEGRRPREFFVIAEGEAEATKGGDHVRMLGPGEFFGQLALIEHAPRFTTVTARTPLRLFVLSSKAFWGLMSCNPEVERRVLRALVIENVAQRTVAEDALRRQVELTTYQALHDSLTGLPNRSLFRDRVSEAVLAGERGGGRFAVLMMDLNRFKEVNDTLGHHCGDALLVEIGARVRGSLRASDTVARIGGDEFGLLIKDANPLEILKVIDKVTAAVEQPTVVDGLPLVVDGSIGVALYPDHGREVDVLVQHADVAMYLAKGEGASYAFYDDAADRHDARQLTLKADLHRAIERRELVLHYQPKAALCTGEISSVEALVRWQHPERGMILPDEFIPLAQQTSLIKPLALYVIDEALRQCVEWRKDGLTLAVAVNLSMRNLLDVNLAGDIGRLLERHGVVPGLLELEMTESSMLADPFRTKAVLDQLSSMGMRISIDDFGTGYSSLAYLKSLPVNEIKIDRSFVTDMLEDEGDSVIVSSTIELGRNLGLVVVAEGVETPAVWERLRALRCDVAQGYFLARPLPPRELAAWLQQRRATETAHVGSRRDVA
jgi:diguanylate cyclase (GGDEF)-like protein